MRGLAGFSKAVVVGFSISLFLIGCSADPETRAKNLMAAIVNNCNVVNSGEKLIPCQVGVGLSKHGISDERYHICKEVSSHSLVERDGFLYHGVGRIEGEPAIAWVYAHALVSDRLEKVTTLKQELIKDEMSGFGIQKWSDVCASAYHAARELLSREQGL